MSETALDAAEVLALARRDGQRWIDDDVAARIADGAAPATRAVALARRSMPDAATGSPPGAAYSPADATGAGVALLGALESLAAGGR